MNATTTTRSAGMNWSFLADEDAESVWDEARRRFFEENEPLDVAFTNALRAQGPDST